MALSDALPGHLDLAPDEVRPLLAGLTDAPLDRAVRLTPEPDLTDTPADLLLANGRSAFERPGAPATPAPDSWPPTTRCARRPSCAAPTGSATPMPRSCSTGLPRPGVSWASTRPPCCGAVLTSGAQGAAVRRPGHRQVVRRRRPVRRLDGRRRARCVSAWPRPRSPRPCSPRRRHRRDEHVGVAGCSASSRRPPVRRRDEAWRLRHGDLVVVDEANLAGHRPPP